MLRLLLDENLSYIVADRLKARRPDMDIVSIHQWRQGELAGKPDHRLLQSAAADGLTLVTSDVNTIPVLLSEWAALGRSHAGVVFVHSRTIRPNDFGRLILTLERFRDQENLDDWMDRVDFLRVLGHGTA